MFIIHGTMDTLTAEDRAGRTFSQILASVCEENGGAINILDIERYQFISRVILIRLLY